MLLGGTHESIYTGQKTIEILTRKKSFQIARSTDSYPLSFW